MRLQELTNLNVSGLIHSWGSKKKKKDIKTFFTLESTNNNYIRQI
jgi:hypothetical protein